MQWREIEQSPRSLLLLLWLRLAYTIPSVQRHSIVMEHRSASGRLLALVLAALTFAAGLAQQKGIVFEAPLLRRTNIPGCTAEHRVALVLGNAAYVGKRLRPLEKTRADAVDMASVLRSSGFEVKETPQ